MKTILTIQQKDIINNSINVEIENYRERRSARAVLLDDSGRIYLLNVGNQNYHKLPGGGIEDGEEIKEALYRELIEEVGCEAKIIAELGQIIEYRDFEDGGLKQISYCYLAKQNGPQIKSNLEEDELSEGMYELKADNIDHAINILKNDKPSNIEGLFIQKRDMAILINAKEYIRKVYDL